ncbi:MAG: DUF3501 family protein [Myxococcales bacterium]|nr:DUF3501 family protein [Myxococcales bacterium]
MQPVQRSEILDYVTYDEQRPTIRASVLAAKAARRILLGEHFAFLFENRDTVRYQVQEMMRTERIVREADIQHELDTYNELLGPKGTLCATLLIGIDDEAERAVKLHQWLELLPHLYALGEDGTRVVPSWDPRQVGDERLSSVQYLSFALGERAPVALGVDWPAQDLVLEVTLGDEQRAALQADLDCA